jgi:hypothetical protein
MLQQVPNGWQSGPDARVITDRAILQRHVEVHPNQHAFAGDINVLNRFLAHVTSPS